MASHHKPRKIHVRKTRPKHPKTHWTHPKKLKRYRRFKESPLKQPKLSWFTPKPPTI